MTSELNMKNSFQRKSVLKSSLMLNQEKNWKSLHNKPRKVKDRGGMFMLYLAKYT